VIFEAIQFAKLKHAGQKRKYTDEPYHNHPLRVAAIVAGLPTANEEQIVAAILHDVLEDTDTTTTELVKKFDSFSYCVIQLTNIFTTQNYPHLNRKQRTEKEHIRLAGICYAAKEIKLADRLDNIRDLHLCPDEGFKHLYTRETFSLLKYLDMPNHPLAVQIEKILYGVK
jgi:(p)ppGpp synthase/HD superfamily hydrolase